MLNEQAQGRLERSCGPSPGDWMRFAPPQAGLERFEAFFAGHAYDRHRHDTYAIGYTIAGMQSFTYRGARADSTRGQVIVLYPDEVHDGHAGTEAGFRYRMLYIEPRLIRDALGGRTSALPFVRTPVVRNSRLFTALRSALRDLGRSLEALEKDQIVLTLAESLVALDPSAPHRSFPRSCAPAVDRARQFLGDHVQRVVASEELEALTGLDRYTLARQFRMRLGTSPYRYLTMRRLDRARYLMRAGSSLADAALGCGFADQSHLTRQFKRAYGISPGRWLALGHGGRVHE